LIRQRHIRITILSIIGLLAFSIGVFAQAISSPQIHCIAIDSTGLSATVTWAIPPDTNKSFVSYDIYYSSSYKGVYSNGATVAPDNQSSVTISGLTANTALYYFYSTTTSGSVSTPSDTARAIYLSVTVLPGVARLNWNPMFTPNLPSFNGWYYIYREYPQYVWKLLDSTKSISYSDTITICKATINYKIVTKDASGCQSVSNRAGGAFQDIIVPQSPVMDSVSVGATGNVSISWYPSSSQNVVGYYVYEYVNNTWTVIDTVFGIGSTYFNYTGVPPGSGSAGTGSLSFRIAAFDSCNNVSPLDNSQNTIFLQQTSNKCAQTNILHWNAYVNLVPAGGWYYELYTRTNGGVFKLQNTTAKTSDTLTGLGNASTFCYFVRVVDSTNRAITAASNIICYQVTLPPPPKFAYMRSATVINNSTQDQVNWYADTGAGIEEYIIDRADAPGGKQISVGTVSATKSLFYSFIDPTANPNNQSYTYTVYCKDSCHYITDSTNIGQTIYLSAVGNSYGTNQLNWNGYQDWKDGVNHYDIYRDEDSGPYSLIGSVSGSITSFTDYVNSIITGQGIFGYYVQAMEQGPSISPIADTSTSNIADAYQNPRLYVPNAFNPNGVNKVFLPVTVFVDLQNYDFTIYDRWGQLIFETTEPTQGWDGTFHGKLVEEGIYIYHIQYTSGKGEYFNLRSWVMMLK
jgi:gliding motility-associated-like protein